jgi:magnesium transporter
MIHERRYGDDGHVRWIDVVDPTQAELDEIAQQFGLEPNTFDEAHRQSARPMLRRYPDHAYVVAFSAGLEEIDLYLGTDWLVTIRHHNGHPLEWDPTETVERFERRAGNRPTAALLLLTLLDVLIDDYFDLTDGIEDRMESVEDGIFSETARAERETQEQLFALRRELLQLRRVVMPLREVLGAISRQEVVGVEGEALMLARDLYDRMLRVVEVVDEQRELLGNAVDAHLAVMSNQMNLVMKQLTAWGSIVFGATLIAGIYGMNFEHMPELRWYYGYPLALGMMAVLSVVLYRVFRRRDWL